MWIATAGGLGYAPVAPGTVGSAATLPVFVLLSLLHGAGLGAAGAGAVGALLAAAVFVLGVWAAGAAESSFGREDDGRIVIDEVQGQLVTLLPLLALPGGLPLDRGGLLWLVTGFVLFRVLDVWKPWPVGWAERGFAGGLGVMMDDLVAGLLGAVALGLALLARGALGFTAAGGA